MLEMAGDDLKRDIKVYDYRYLKNKKQSNSELIQSGNPPKFDFGHWVSMPTLQLTSGKRLLSESNFAQYLSPGNNCCSTSFFILGPNALFFYRGEEDRARETSASPPSLTLMPIGPNISNKSNRCFTPSLESQSNYLSSIKINNSWLGWCGQRL